MMTIRSGWSREEQKEGKDCKIQKKSSSCMKDACGDVKENVKASKGKGKKTMDIEEKDATAELEALH
ncbi:hypothetical protein AgCh_019078 [Apium graveolens]